MKYTVILASLLLAGCSTVSDVMPIGSGKYLVGSQSRGGVNSWAEVKAMAIQKANEYCSSKNSEAEVIDIKTHGAQGWTPQNADVTFKCTNK